MLKLQIDTHVSKAKIWAKDLSCLRISETNKEFTNLWEG